MSAPTRIAKLAASFGRFWWDFIVGDDVVLAVGVVLGLGAVAALHHAHLVAWWAAPVVAALALLASLTRATRQAR